jgi:hypothetical protein
MALRLFRYSDHPGHRRVGSDHPMIERATSQKHQNCSLEMMTPAAAHRRRCKSLPPMRPGEADRLIADFLAAKSITVCPTRYAAPVEQRLLVLVHGH